MALLTKASDFGHNASRTMSERWQTFSLPGAIRRAKTAMAGASKMPNDPLEEQRSELLEMDSLISSLSVCAKTVATAVDMLAAAPIPLFDPLSRFYGHGTPGSHAIERLCAQLNDFSSRSKDQESGLDLLQARLQTMSERNKAAHQSFGARDIAWSSQDHYVKKVEKLKEQIAKSGTSHALVQKLNRNEQKKHDSQQEFAHHTGETGRQVSEALENRWQEIGEVVAQLCQYYISIFQACSGLSHELHAVHQELTKPSTAEALLRRGKEMALQAKESTNQLVNSLRAKYSSWSDGVVMGEVVASASSRPSSNQGQVISSSSQFGGFEAGGYSASQPWPAPASNGSQGSQWPSWPGAKDTQNQPRSPWDTAQVQRPPARPAPAPTGRSPWS
mmetsp:Transcript_42897/g.93335  ORF Transcript_42897/g.93335 Transcript_42897/m.93335 type:complete len:389 (-) Transcript_42897:8-1174(-)